MINKKAITRIGFIIFIVVFILAVLPPRPAHADLVVLYVAASEIGDCSSWSSACTLSTALAKATSINDIWVKAGVHIPDTAGLSDPQNATFSMVKYVGVYGGFKGDETSREQRDWSRNITVLSGDIDQNDITDPSGIVLDPAGVVGYNARRVVTINAVAAVELDGFVITGGYDIDGFGAGMYVYGVQPRLTNLVFIGNRANQGGAIFINYSAGTILANVVFSHNTAKFGGAIYNEQSEAGLFNVSFSGNSAEDAGGGMYNSDGSTPYLKNSIMWGDIAANGPEIQNDYYSSTDVFYSDIKGGYIGKGNINKDPKFTDAVQGNLHIGPTSPVVNKGNSSYLHMTTDLNHLWRISGPAVDMGAYEVQPAPVQPGVPILVSPKNNALSNTLGPWLDWNNAANAFLYQIQVTTNNSFTSPEIDQTGISVSAFSPNTDFSVNTTYYWRVLAVNIKGIPSAWSAVRSFRTALPAPITLTVDTSNNQNLRPVFKWEMPEGYPGPAATGYTLVVSKNDIFTQIVHTGTIKTTNTSYVPTADLPRNRGSLNPLYWRVRANGKNGPSAWSDNSTYTTGNPPSIPSLMKPADKVLVTNLNPLLDWSDSKVTGGTPAFDHYVLQVTTGSVTIPFYPTLSQFNFPGGLAANATYTWQVQACSTIPECSALSKVRSFKTPLLPPSLLGPPDHAVAPNATIDDRKPFFTWDANPDASGYSIQISKNTGFTTLVGTYNVTLPTYQPKANLPNLPLYWRVRAKNSNGAGMWSNAWMLIEESIPVSTCDGCHH
jgi:predicted outer membrane repeat protein